MCTGLCLSTKDGKHLFGRNLDVPASYNQAVQIVPRNFKWLNVATQETITSKYACIAMGIVIDNHPLLFDGVNEKGLAGGGLNFTHFAKFSSTAVKDKISLSASDFVYWVLSTFSSLSELKETLPSVILTSIPFKPDLPVAGLHWIFTDKTGESIVVEKTVNGLKVMDNKVGVLTNAPTFDWHLTNLTQYMGLTATQPQDTTWGEQNLKPLGQGLGAFGLPGDYSSPSRFVKAAFLRNHIDYADVNYSGMSEFFHILNGVAMVRGSVVTPQHLNDITLYTSCIDQEKGIYYYKTYTNHSISAINMYHEDLDAKEVKLFTFNDEFTVMQQN